MSLINPLRKSQILHCGVLIYISGKLLETVGKLRNEDKYSQKERSAARDIRQRAKIDHFNKKQSTIIAMLPRRRNY
jgi:hypothetical protein